MRSFVRVCLAALSIAAMCGVVSVVVAQTAACQSLYPKCDDLIGLYASQECNGGGSSYWVIGDVVNYTLYVCNN